MAKSDPFIPLAFSVQEERVMEASAALFYQQMSKRRSVRDFSDQPIPRSVLEHAILTAGSAPSGANMQPWHFVVVQDPAIKKQIRDAAEIEERELYDNRASDEWLQALAPLGTDPNKPFLERAPALIAVFLKKVTIDEAGVKHKNYYPSESVGIATGMLITALHQAGLGTLTHTPSPMKFLTKILDRPSHERPFLLLVVGYPAAGALVPDIERLSFGEIATFI
ncbi:MAG: nitroreductase family protein [Porticoccaceae bacterium]|jgi:nitroreductase|nr:nitroreductase family protein [Porticoccaceae bacterium]|tara:strand:- start:842 stop:1510 length:669 start_codon:yes stop_codon:yes gene_type:complete